MKNLQIYYRVTAQGLHSIDYEYYFLLSDDEGRKSGMPIPVDRAVAVLSKIIKHFQSKEEDICVDCFYNGELIASPSTEADLAKKLLATWTGTSDSNANNRK